MIDKALALLQNEVDSYVRARLNIEGTAPVVELSRITNSEGKLAIADDKVGMSLVNVEEERVLREQEPGIQRGGDEVSYMNPEVRVNLFVLFISNHEKYAEGLKRLSAVMSFFQSRSVFDSESTPQIDPSIRRLAVDLYSLPFEQLNYLWATLATSYLPSVLYRVRVVSIRDEQILFKGKRVEAIDIEAEDYD